MTTSAKSYTITFATEEEARCFFRWRETSCIVASSGGKFATELVNAAIAIDNADVVTVQLQEPSDD